MKELLIMAKSLGGGGSEVALIELINALPEELYNITLVLLDSDNEYAYRLKKKVNIVQLTFNSSFAKSLVSMYAFRAKVLKKLSVNSFIPYYDFISNCVTNVFEKTYDVAIDFYGYGSFVTAFLAKKIQAKKKATWIHDEKPYWMKSVQKYLCEYDKIYGVSQAVVDAFCREYPHYKDKAAVFYNVIDIELNQKITMVSGEQTSISFVKGESLPMLAKLLNILTGDKYGYEYSDITILSLRTELDSILHNTNKLSGIPILKEKSNSAVLFTTAKKFKGLESRVVIIIDIDEDCFNDEEKKRNFYIACSRATQKLLLFINADEKKLQAMADAISSNRFAAKGKIAMKTQSRILKLT